MSQQPPECPFVAGPMIQDPRLFVGRRSELQTLTGNMTGPQPVSINVIGERRIGKSSLLHHFFQTWEDRVEPARQDQFVVIYLSLQDAAVGSEAGLFQAIVRQLADRPLVRSRPALARVLQGQGWDRLRFDRLIREDFAGQGLLPVLCLDEFEVLFRYPESYDDNFFDGLRSLMNASCLMLVTASYKPLDVYRQEQRLTSSFFNLGHTLELGSFNDSEAVELVCLPSNRYPGASSALETGERKLALAWGRRHPFRLQLAAYFLLQARRQGRDVAFAKERFRREDRRLRNQRVNGPSWGFGWLWWGVEELGRLAVVLGSRTDELRNVLVGIVIVVLLVLALAGNFGLNDIWATFRGLVGGVE